MAMNVGSSSGDGEVMVEINTTPLIDVMLVLLIMLIITIPIQLHAVNLNLPIASPPPPATPPEVVRIEVLPGSVVSWNGENLADFAQLESRLDALAAREEQPEIHLRPNKDAAYKTVAAVMAAVQRHNLTKIGLVGAEQFQ